MIPPVTTDDVYVELLTAVVQRFITLMGHPAVRLARRVYGLQVGEDGSVAGYRGDGALVLQGVIVEYLGLLGPEQVMPLCRRAIRPVLDRNPRVTLPPLLR